MSGPLNELLAAALSGGAANAVLAYGDDSAPPVERFLDGVGELCPFLGRLMTREPTRLERVLAASADDHFAPLLPGAELADLPIDEVKKALRDARNDVLLALALADLAGLYDLDAITETLTRLADASIGIALKVGAREASGLRGVKFENEPTPHHGLIIIAMGKLGARELNYSSDIDLVAIYDPARTGLSPESRLDERGIAVKTVQFMVDILSDQTADGFVFRTDLRLRPNPGSTSVAVSVAAAEIYYEAYGQNWERAAFIKGRLCAGDRDLDDAFARMIRPFVWRRTLDYHAVADIHAVKNQIHAQKGRPDLDVPGADVKLGPGGIREIEFFAQTQQLLLGGRDTALRSPRTEAALTALACAGHIDHETALKLGEAYRYLRAVEHRLQMREDEQTQTLPEDRDGLSRIAALMNMTSVDDFIAKTEAHMRYVHDAYAELFETPEPHEPVPGSLVFTGVEDDPRTLETLRKIGFDRPDRVTEQIRRWHQGSLRATRSVRARELLTALVPRILMRLGDLPSPDEGFAALDTLLSHLPAGFQVFSLFTAEPAILDNVILLCQASPELVRKFGERPALIEGLLEGIDISVPDAPFVAPEADFESHLDGVRRIVNEHRIRAAAGLILGHVKPYEVASALSQAADEAIAELTEAVLREAQATGKAPEGELAVLGFGRLGIGALTMLSDLDLVFVYDLEKGSEEGERLYTRLVRRIVSALSVPTPQGDLYEIDMQLRPSGRAGPTAVSFAAFDQYYRDTAWTWELMALTKARVVYGGAKLKERIEQARRDTLCQPRDAVAIARDVIDMRQRLLTEKSPRTPLDVKRLPGGLTDIEFIVQYLVLVNSDRLGPLPRHPRDAIAVLKEANALSDQQADELTAAHELNETLIHYLRATEGGAPPELLFSDDRSRIHQLSDVWTNEPIEVQLATHTSAVRKIFEELIGPYSAEI